MTPIYVLLDLTLSDLLNNMEHKGISELMILLICVFIYASIKNNLFGNFFNKISDYMANKITSKPKSKHNKHNSSKLIAKKTDIINHEFFSSIDLWINTKIPSLIFATPFKTAVFRDYLTIFLTTYRDNIYDFVKSEKYTSLNGNDLWVMILNLLNNIDKDCEEAFKKNNIPPLVITKMKSEDIINMTMVTKSLNDICKSPIYTTKDNYVKMYGVLNILKNIIDTTVEQSESICSTINGSLKGLTYKGITEK